MALTFFKYKIKKKTNKTFLVWIINMKIEIIKINYTLLSYLEWKKNDFFGENKQTMH